MNVLSITWKDLQIFLKDLGRVFMAFLLPLVFIFAYGLAYSEVTAGGVNLVALPTVNLDAGGEMSEALIESLNRGRGHEVKLYEEAEAMDLVEKGDIARALIIPAGFTTAVEAGQQTSLRLVNGPEASDTDTEATYTVIDGAAKDLSLQTQLVAAFRQMEQMMLASTQGMEIVFTSDAAVAQAQSQFERSKTAPLVGVEQVVPETILREREAAPGPLEIAVPGFTVLFCFLTAQVTALSIYGEKKIGTFRRLLASPLSRAELLGGKMVPNLIIVLLQIIVIFAVGVWVMPLLGLDKISPGNLPALAVVSIFVALASTTLGVLIAALARTEGQIGGIAAIVLWVAGALGGAFIPQFAMGDFLNTVGQVTPHYWAINGFTDIIVRGQGLAGVTTQIGVLALFAILFFGLGAWRFRFD
jgi:ABC-2 type transport system permease protein